MTEDEYINATNLAKVRIMRSVLRDILPHGPLAEEDEKQIASILRRWEDALVPLVQ